MVSNIFYFHLYLAKMNPFWLIFFKGVETTNQITRGIIGDEKLASYIGIIKTIMTRWWWFQTFLNFSPRFVWERWSDFTLAYYFSIGLVRSPPTSHASMLASKWRTQSYFHIEMMAFFRTSWLILTAFGCWRYDPGLLVSTSAREWSDAGGLYQRVWRNDWLALLYLLWAETGQRIQCSLDVLPLQVEDNWTHNPPCGEGHRDHSNLHQILFMRFLLEVYIIRIDCRNTPVEEIAREIAAALRKPA